MIHLNYLRNKEETMISPACNLVTPNHEVNITNKHLVNTQCIETRNISSKSPSIGYQLNKVLILFNRWWNSWVIIIPFYICDFTIVIFISKVCKEFKEGFILSDFSRNNFWVQLRVVDHFQIKSIYFSLSLKIEFRKGGVNNCLSDLI